VAADADQVERALRNLIDNAVRYAGPSGHVIVGADESVDYVQFSVADDGPGVPLGDQARVFEPFVGAGTDEGRAGLGLAIAREIVRAHGGDIWVDSGPGPGAVFTFTLPTAVEHVTPSAVARASDDQATGAQGLSQRIGEES
jgi:NtrC-family two-component system sensor histidine kinase KinB